MPVRMSGFSSVLMVGLVATSTIVATMGPSDRAAASISQVSGTPRLQTALQQRSPAPMPTIGRPAPEKWPDTPAAINSLHRDSSGFVTLIWTLTYNGANDFTLPVEFVSVYKYAPAPFSAITLTDESAKIRYNPLRADPSGKCICTDNATVPNDLNKGQSATLYQVFKLPSNVTSVTVSIPGYSPAKNIAVN